MVEVVASVDCDGKTWHWCPYHKQEGCYDVQYISHKSEEHSEWKLRHEKYEAQCRNTWNTNGTALASVPNEQHKRLALNDTSKSALLTHCQLITTQPNTLLQDVDDNQYF